jgi:hypothetical protein
MPSKCALNGLSTSQISQNEAFSDEWVPVVQTWQPDEPPFEQ